MDASKPLLPPDSVEYVPPPMSLYLRVTTWLIQRVNLVLFKIPIIKGIANRYYTNRAAATGHNRPYQLSCKEPYSSWESLTDYTFYGRHLPPAEEGYTDSLPSIDKVAEIFKRVDGVQTLCPKSTMLFPTFAQHLIDSFIVTKTEKPKTKGGAGNSEVKFLWKETRTNHDIGLIPLYGRNFDQTKALRLKSNKPGEKGRLKSQMIGKEEFAPFLYKDGSGTKLSDPEFEDVLDEPQGLEHIIKHMPSKESVRAKIFAFGGERTNLTPQITALNTLLLREHNRVAGELEAENKTWDDEQVFQTARNVVVVLYCKLVVEEYINHITSAGLSFKVEPKPWVWNAPWYKRNWISAEFAVLYRWHALIPNSQKLGGTPTGTLDAIFDNARVINNGSLRNTFIEICQNRATVMKCFNTEKWMVDREKAALRQSRECQLRPFADYMEYLGEKRPKTFADISKE